MHPLNLSFKRADKVKFKFDIEVPDIDHPLSIAWEAIGSIQDVLIDKICVVNLGNGIVAKAHEDCLEKIEFTKFKDGERVWHKVLKKILIFANFVTEENDQYFYDSYETLYRTAEIIKLSEFEPEVMKNYIFKEWKAPCHFSTKLKNGSYLFGTGNNVFSYSREQLEQYLIGEYEEEAIETTLITPNGNFKIKPGETMIFTTVKEEAKMREFVAGKKYDKSGDGNNYSPFIFVGYSNDKQKAAFEDKDGDIQVYCDKDLNLFTEHRELEVKKICVYIGKRKGQSIESAADSNNFYESPKEVLPNSTYDKVYKLDITATEVSQEEIEKAKEKVNA